MPRASLAVERMSYFALLRRLDRELRELEASYPPAVRGGELETRYRRIRLLTSEIAARGLQGRLEL